MISEAKRLRNRLKARERWARMIANGLCPKCGNQRDGEQTRCESCRMKEKWNAPDHYTTERLAVKAAHWKALYARRKAAGDCTKCGNPSKDGHVRCDTCRASYQEYRKRYAKTIPGWKGEAA
jgi:hypothetical protein